MENDFQHLLTIDEASKLLSIKVSRLRTAIFRKEIPFIKIGRLVRFQKSELVKWINSKKVDQKEDSWLW